MGLHDVSASARQDDFTPSLGSVAQRDDQDSFAEGEVGSARVPSAPAAARPAPDRDEAEMLAILASLFPRGLTGARVLEAGIGPPRISEHLHRCDARVTRSQLVYRGAPAAGRWPGSRNLEPPSNGVRADLLKLPFHDHTFDVVWNAGVLEHLAPDALVPGLREMARVSSRMVVVFVTHAFCIPYNFARMVAVDAGTWPWPQEDPKRTLRGPFAAAGIEVLDEFDFGGSMTALLSCLAYVPAPFVPRFEAQMLRPGLWSNGMWLATIGAIR